jgi:hypothetical protein
MRSEATSLLNKGKAILELFGTERESQRGVVNAMKKEADRLRAMDYDDLSSFEKDSLNAADTYIRNTTANFQSSDNLIDRYMAVTSFTSRILSGFVTDHSNF